MKTIRVIARAVDVLRRLDASPGQSLAVLAASTGLPKASLLRILATLEQERLVWRSIGDGLYRNRITVTALSESHLRHYRLAELASPILEGLQRSVIWPSDLAVRQGHCMEMVETSRRVSPLSITRDPLGFRVDMLLSAVGRAYLAHCPPDECARIVQHLRAHPQDCVVAQRVSLAGVKRTLEQTRVQGYGKRDPSFGKADGLDAIAVPVSGRGGRVLGCLNVVWPRRFDLERDVARMHLPRLRQAAAALALAMEDADA